MKCLVKFGLIWDLIHSILNFEKPIEQSGSGASVSETRDESEKCDSEESNFTWRASKRQ